MGNVGKRRIMQFSYWQLQFLNVVSLLRRSCRVHSQAQVGPRIALQNSRWKARKTNSKIISTHQSKASKSQVSGSYMRLLSTAEANRSTCLDQANPLPLRLSPVYFLLKHLQQMITVVKEKELKKHERIIQLCSKLCTSLFIHR